MSADTKTSKLMKAIHESPVPVKTKDLLYIGHIRTIRSLLHQNEKRGYLNHTNDGKRQDAYWSMSTDQYKKYLAGSANWKSGVVSTSETTGTILGSILLLASRPEGIDRTEKSLHVTGDLLSKKLSKLKEQGRVIGVQFGIMNRYFTNQVHASAFKALNFHPVPEKRAKYARIARPLMSASVHSVAATDRAKWNAAKPCNPNNVKVQRCPTPPGRFEHVGPVVGGFVSEWKALRKGRS